LALPFLLSSRKTESHNPAAPGVARHTRGNLITGFTQLRQFRNVSNFNVGLLCQQVGLTLNETLSFAGLYAARFSSNADATRPYGLNTDAYNYIVVGYKVGQSGVYGQAAPPPQSK
jgi:hypothetical protein